MDLEERLQSLGLDQYASAFKEEGFETWSQLMDITETDLSANPVALVRSSVNFTLTCIVKLSE